MEETRLTTLQKRILSSLAMVPVVIGSLYFGYPYADLLMLIVGMLFAWEWSTMVPNNKPCVYLACYAFALACAFFLLDLTFLFAVLVLIGAFVYYKAKSEQHRFLLALGVFYISIGIGALYRIYLDVFLSYEVRSFVMIMWFVLIVWSVDVGAYAIGSTLKGPKLAPKISPNKTWSGLIGGMIAAAIVSYTYMFAALHFSNVIPTASGGLYLYAVLGAVIAIIAQIGDLAESAIKRHLNIKDSSQLIPGHGGIFDRIDGLVFAAPFVYCFFEFFAFN